MNMKAGLYDHCVQFVQERITHIKDEIRQVQSSANKETRSSAGDKYETGRAMAQLEIEMNARQLVEAEKLMASLAALPKESGNSIRPGSLVTTSKGTYYLAISVGQVQLNSETYFVVSPDSPIGRLLIGNRVGDQFEWGGEAHVIRSIG